MRSHVQNLTTGVGEISPNFRFSRKKKTFRTPVHSSEKQSGSFRFLFRLASVQTLVYNITSQFSLSEIIFSSGTSFRSVPARQHHFRGSCKKGLKSNLVLHRGSIRKVIMSIEVSDFVIVLF